MDFMKNIEKATGVKQKDILKVANSFQNANLQDERTVRKLIREISRLANKPISKQLENKIVDNVVNNKVPKNMEQLKKKTGF
ncbi:stage VI sporulation protein F [Salirhabdus salicampi]|uniref:stage VI sporulation protein F n=1 Tax=Salirhabdus salicampi TaxID=476102 RepID=UPI0020C59A98|nr:stage VI sporulation protein F [Salirhabdus salicampi]MCP8617356.1 stage VI sporulation protein F [Salirhabdus salicampi]